MRGQGRDGLAQKLPKGRIATSNERATLDRIESREDSSDVVDGDSTRARDQRMRDGSQATTQVSKHRNRQGAGRGERDRRQPPQRVVLDTLEWAPRNAAAEVAGEHAYRKRKVEAIVRLLGHRAVGNRCETIRPQ